MNVLRATWKVCGMRESDNIRQVATLKPDYMGFIFYEPSSRFVGYDFIIPAELPPSTKRVGVFVNHSISFVKATARKHQLHYAQLHGEESITYCEELGQQDIKIIKVFRVDEDFDFDTTHPFEQVADYFLFDTKGKLYGGNAKPFDWTLLNKYNQSVPFFLSGGINADNIKSLKEYTLFNIHAIDINSGVEDKPGVKNTDKISEIINHLHI